MRTLLAVLSVAALGACTDGQLVAPNFNAPDRGRALASAADVENMIASQFRAIHQSTDAGDNVASEFLCFGLENFSRLANGSMDRACAIPRAGIGDGRENAGPRYRAYLNLYRAARSEAMALQAASQPGFTFQLQSAARVARDRAFGYFALGVALGDIALVYDSGAVVSPGDDTRQQAPPFVGHDSLMAVAMAYLDTAQEYASIAPTLGGDNDFQLPSTWINGLALTGGASGSFVQLVRSYRARFRAGSARTPADRAAVNWAQVVTDATDGITSDIKVLMTRGSPSWTYRPVFMDLFGSWHQMWQFVVGMADSSGLDSLFLADPEAHSPFLVVTPDKRFPSGTTRAAQNASSGCSLAACLQPSATAPFPYLRNRLTGADTPGDPLGFSMYDFYRFQSFFNAAGEGPIPIFTLAELNGLIAEGLIRQGSVTAALPYINASRVPAGLPAVTMADTVTRVPGGAACVPKIPAGPGFTSSICGNVWEAMKWEKRLETAYTHWGAWWIDGRGWGDLPVSTPLELPTPFQELETRGRRPYSAVQVAARGTYGL